MKWIKASERMPTQELGIEIIGKSKNGRVDNYSWDNMMKFHRPCHHESDELYEWLDESQPDVTSSVFVVVRKSDRLILGCFNERVKAEKWANDSANIAIHEFYV